MEKSRFKSLLFALAGLSAVSGGLLLYFLISATTVTRESLRNDAFFVYDTPIAVNPFRLVDHEGNEFTEAGLRGKWSLVFFGYTFCPDICPLTLATIRQFYDLLPAEERANVQVIMVSVDPQRDTPEVLANYVRFFNPEFIGVTGEYGRLFTVARQMNVAFTYIPVDDEHYLVTHNGEIMLLAPDGTNTGFFKPPYMPDAMLENFRAARRFWQDSRH